MPKILIIEENTKFADLIRLYLEKKGFGVGLAIDGTSAIRSFAGGTYDLLLVNIKLPSIDGEGVCRKIRESAKGRAIPIILMSGTAKEPSEIDRLKKELHIAGFLIKPFSSDSLYSLIKSSLQGQAAHEAAAMHQAASKKPLQSIRGDLEKSPFEQVLLYLMRKRGTGILNLTAGARNRRFFFIDGAPVEIDLPPEEEDFGSFLIQKKLIDAVELREYEERKKKEETDPRDIFIKMGCLTPEKYYEENRNFLNDRLIDSFSWKGGSFVFEWRPSFINTIYSAGPFMPFIFYKGFKAHLSPAKISVFMEDKGNLYIDKTSEFFEFQNHLASEVTGADIFSLIDGLKSCNDIVNSVEVDDATVILFTLDYLKAVSFSNKPKESEVTPPFPIRERAASAQIKETERFEDIGAELSELADEIGGLGEPAGPKAAGEAEGLSVLEGELKKKWEEIKDKNYYEIFGMTANSFAFDQLKKSYFEYTKTYGPEKFFASSSEVMNLTEELLSKVSNAYNTLSNVVSKENYDEMLSSQTAAPTGDEEKEFHQQIQFQSGKVFLEQGQFDSAEKAFINCINIDPGKPEYLAYLAVAVYNNPANKGNPTAVKRAKDMINRSLQFGKLSIAYALKGTMLLDEGSINLAEAEFNKALKLNPNNKTALKKMEFIRERREESKKGLFQKMFK